jgi:hypothetical protein
VLLGDAIIQDDGIFTVKAGTFPEIHDDLGSFEDAFLVSLRASLHIDLILPLLQQRHLEVLLKDRNLAADLHLQLLVLVEN